MLLSNVVISMDIVHDSVFTGSRAYERLFRTFLRLENVSRYCFQLSLARIPNQSGRTVDQNVFPLAENKLYPVTVRTAHVKQDVVVKRELTKKMANVFFDISVGVP